MEHHDYFSRASFLHSLDQLLSFPVEAKTRSVPPLHEEQAYEDEAYFGLRGDCVDGGVVSRVVVQHMVDSDTMATSAERDGFKWSGLDKAQRALFERQTATQHSLHNPSTRRRNPHQS